MSVCQCSRCSVSENSILFVVLNEDLGGQLGAFASLFSRRFFHGLFNRGDNLFGELLASSWFEMHVPRLCEKFGRETGRQCMEVVDGDSVLLHDLFGHCVIFYVITDESTLFSFGNQSG